MYYHFHAYQKRPPFVQCDNLKCPGYFLPFIYRDEYLAKIARRVKEYEIKVLNEPRAEKKLLVLDVDYTLFGTIRHNPINCFAFRNFADFAHKPNLVLIFYNELIVALECHDTTKSNKCSC